ncbi:MAG: hypothetical protein FD145_126 [Candidatus Saganbacteria bacterium]|uniref:LPS-assembly protein LptD n=1 Tax=Candidatus Saganbacteria bacterium TaxID=2575572 RepID=A0A833NST2_UNCSA|nr:MAG: hypothetical protein FD145_126 [Candidatus Saganbacteria bacterium]
MKKYFLAIFIFSSIALAQEKDLVINASKMDYNQEKGIIEAFGSVEAKYKNITILGEHLIYNSISREVFLDSGFDFQFNGVNFIGKELNYNINEETGSGKSVKIKYEKANITGDEIKFNSNEIKIKGAVFDACGLAPPHYHLAALGLDLYQKQGWFAAYWGVFWLGSLPSLPVPVYVYDFRADLLGKKNVMPYPEIGVNDEDGLWISESMSWYLRPDINGKYGINHAVRKGTGGMFNILYRLDNNKEYCGEIFISNYESLRGWLEYRNYFGQEIDQKTVYFDVPKQKKYELDVKISSRERINFERVSMLPNIKISGKKIGAMEGSLELGNIDEETTKNTHYRFNFLGKLAYVFYDDFYPSLDADLSFYGNSTHWLKTIGILAYRKSFDETLNGELKFSHFFSNLGQSPFNYEKYRFVSKDKVGLMLKKKSFFSNFAFNCEYSVSDFIPQEIDYTAGLSFHCFDVDLTYKVMRQEFVLGFSLK